MQGVESWVVLMLSNLVQCSEYEHMLQHHRILVESPSNGSRIWWTIWSSAHTSEKKVKRLFGPKRPLFRDDLQLQL
ncbi:hypothetical protein BR93DRAFT_926761 [Coniochaeta sp. PMI_546]|nr:hypothetical protein BR93DRAFT_926761 [Coniochaeta sp. PMI_546]